MKIRLAQTVLVIVLVSLACDEDTDSTMILRLRADLPGIEIQVRTARDMPRVFEAGDFSERDIVDAFTIPDSGPIELEVRLVENGTLAAEGSVSFTLREATRWGVDIFRQVDDPSGNCFGCEGSRAFPIDPSSARTPGEAIWITWGGAREGVVF